VEKSGGFPNETTTAGTSPHTVKNGSDLYGIKVGLIKRGTRTWWYGEGPKQFFN